jgi:hypothetical protein
MDLTGSRPPFPTAQPRAAMLRSRWWIRSSRSILGRRNAHEGAAVPRVIFDRKGLGVSQGGKLTVALPLFDAAISVETSWVDCCDLRITALGGGQDTGVLVDVDEGSNEVSVRDAWGRSGGKGSMKLQIEACVPQVFDLDIACGKGDIAVNPKLEGSASLSTQGNVAVRVVRGENIVIRAGADVTAKELEACDIDVKCKNLTSKVLRGNVISVHSGGSASLGGLYGSTISVKADDCISVSSAHGSLQAYAPSGSIILRGVSGSARVESGGDVNIHFDAISPSSISEVTSRKGRIAASCSPDVSVKVQSEGPSFDVESDHWVPGTEAGEGSLSGLKTELRSAANIAGGKVDARAARDQRLSGYEPEADTKGLPGAQLILCSAKGTSLESLGWMDAIKKRHGITSF